MQDIEVLSKESGNVAFGLVVIALQTDTGSVGERAAPAGEQVHSSNVGSALRLLFELAIVCISLQRKTVARTIPVGTETHLSFVPAVSNVAAVGTFGILTVEIFSIDAKMTAGVQFCPVPPGATRLHIPSPPTA